MCCNENFLEEAAAEQRKSPAPLVWTIRIVGTLACTIVGVFIGAGIV
jgi:hypothetical protein